MEGRNANSIIPSARKARSWLPLVTGVLFAASFTGERVAYQLSTSPPKGVVLSPGCHFTKHMKGYVWAACKDYVILYKKT